MENHNAVSALGALAQEDRLAAFRLLMSVGKEGLPSGEIAERLEIQPTRMSFHLSTLERAGLLLTRREGRRILYSVDQLQMRSLLSFLMKDCCGNNPEICGFSNVELNQPAGS